MTVCLGGLVVRLGQLQGLQSQQYVTIGKSEYVHTITLDGERGAILDRSGDELAMSVPQSTIYADPQQVTNAAAEAAKLAPVLQVPEAALQAELSQHNQFVYLARTVSDATATAVAKLNLAGVDSIQEPKRFDPAGQLAAPIVGTVGMEGTGLSGLELKYDSLLAGKPGKLVEELDPAGGEIPGGLQQYQAPVRGDDLVLSIDEPLQYDTEQALARAIVAAGAQSGIAMIMDTKTGELLSVANLTMPSTSDPVTEHEPPAVPVTFATPTTSAPASATASTTSSVPPGGPPQPVEAPTASAFTNVYEPGSVNKLITISAALSEGVIVPSDHFIIPNTYNVAGTAFHDAENHPTEDWSVTDILANSSNIGTMQIAQRLGKQSLVNFLHAYGMGEVSNVGFPGESAGLLLAPDKWSGTSIATVAIGQGIAVTAVQMLAAYNTVANGGVYVAPKLVDGYIDASGQEHTFASPAPRRVVSSTVAAEMTQMLDEVVRVGTGTAANLGPYTVAGKTGTALVPLNGGYEAGHYVASFAGFVPAEKPSLTAMVVIDDTPDYGAAASAPTFATIVRDALQQFDIPPQKADAQLPGVPRATPQSAQGAGEVAGTPLPGLTGAPVTSTTSVASSTTSTSTTRTTSTSSAGPAEPGGGQGTARSSSSPPTTP
jgi:cell division protein FtsI (penicillin-binding protein 3)